MKHVIIGNGVAGMSAANEIRAQDSQCEITVISRESEHFFSRTALMYEFCGQLSRKDLEPFERDHYDRMNFKKVFDEVTTANFDAQELQLKGGEKIPYDKLLLACGSVPRPIPWQKGITKGIGHFVTLQDLEWLKLAAANCELGTKRAIVVGGGLIGIEAVEVLLHAGIEVHFVIREDWYWPIALNKAESAFVAKHMREHGCHVHLNSEVKEVKSESGALKGVELSTGEVLETDLCVVAIGVMPATSWLEETDLALSEGFRAIEVNQYLETNIENVYSTGDCANVTWFNGVRRPEQLWYTSRDQGVAAAHNMIGVKEEYKRGPLYNSAKFFDIEYTTAGLVNFPLEGLSEWYQEDATRCWSQRIVIQDGAVIGFNMLGSRWDHRVFIKWIEQKRSLEWVLEHLSEATYDAEFTSKFKLLSSARRYTL